MTNYNTGMLSILLLLKGVHLFAADGLKELHEQCVTWPYDNWDDLDGLCSGDLKCAQKGHTLQGNYYNTEPRSTNFWQNVMNLFFSVRIRIGNYYEKS